jgi:hypothetical protein
VDSTTIEVLIASSDYSCCGVPFAVGDDIRFTLARMVDENGDRYYDDRHPAEDGLPHRDVGGRVEAIVAVYDRMVPVAGAHYLTNDPTDTIERVVEAVPAADEPDGYGGATYRVTFRIPADTVLPAPRRPFAPHEITPAPRPERAHLLTRIVDEVEETSAMPSRSSEHETTPRSLSLRCERTPQRSAGTSSATSCVWRSSVRNGGCRGMTPRSPSFVS